MSNHKLIVSIDPGNILSGVAFVDGHTFAPLVVFKAENKHLERDLLNSVIQDLLCENSLDLYNSDIHIVIEKFQSYGMKVGQTTMDAIFWGGRFYQWAIMDNYSVSQIFRKDVKRNLCGRTTANDQNIKGALVERFARNVPNYGKGKKASPGWFYGFKADIWSAYAVAVTLIDLRKGDYDGTEEDYRETYS